MSHIQYSCHHVEWETLPTAYLREWGRWKMDYTDNNFFDNHAVNITVKSKSFPLVHIFHDNDFQVLVQPWRNDVDYVKKCAFVAETSLNQMKLFCSLYLFQFTLKYIGGFTFGATFVNYLNYIVFIHSITFFFIASNQVSRRI